MNLNTVNEATHFFHCKVRTPTNPTTNIASKFELDFFVSKIHTFPKETNTKSIEWQLPVITASRAQNKLHIFTVCCRNEDNDTSTI